mmetsp:Transcript_75774/g.181164  ORF Transcript_75774/g.181164 Transcript_75774/m.181164 type:complete len:262 (-) Transcript_75774:129-914(-)
MHHLHALHPNDERELRYDVQDHPAQLDNERVSNDAKAFNTQTEPNRERKPSDDQQDGELAKVGVSLKPRLLALAVLFDLQSVVEEHDEGQDQTKAIPSKAQRVSCEHGGSATKEHRHREEWHHEAPVAGNAGACQDHQLQLHDGARGDPLHRPGQVQREGALSAGQIEVINRSELQDVEESREQRHSCADGGTNCVALLQRRLLGHRHLRVVREDKPHGQPNEADTLDDLRDVVRVVEVHLLARTLRRLQSPDVVQHIADG